MTLPLILGAASLLAMGISSVRPRVHRHSGVYVGVLLQALTAARVPPAIAKMGGRLPTAARVRQSLDTAEISAQNLGAARVAAAAALFVGSAVLSLIALPLGVVVLASAALAPFCVDLLVIRAAREYGTRVADQLPDALDLLSAAAGAGMALDPALNVVGRRVGGPLGHELSVMRADLERGATRGAAYEAFQRRVPRPDVDALTGALLRADRLGSPLAETLARQADAMRHARSERVRDAAAKAGPKIQLVVALLMVPATLMLVIGLLLLELVRQVNAVIGAG